jgi:hypothetical protein
MAVAIIITGRMKRPIPTSIPMFISFFIQTIYMVFAADKYAAISPALTMTMILSVISSSLALRSVENMSVRKQQRILTGCGLMFAGLSVLLIAGDVIISRLTGLGILPGFWFLLIQLGGQIVLTALSCLIPHASSKALKTQLS